MKIRKFDLCFFALSIINVLFYVLIGKNYLCYILFLFNLFSFITKQISREDFLIYSLFIPDKYLQLISCVCYFYRNGKLVISSFNKKQQLFFIYALFFSVMNCILYKGILVGTIFQFIVYYCIFQIINNKEFFYLKNVFNIFKKMIWLQGVTCLIEYIIYRKTGDFLNGTMFSAHYLGVFLIVYGYMFFKLKYKKNISDYISIFITFICLVFGDAKHIWFIFIFSYLITLFLNKVRLRNKITVVTMGITFFIISFVYFTESDLFHQLTNNSQIVNTYIFNSNYNKKLQFFTNTFDQMKSWNGIFGFGIGQYGSQISITMSKGLIYDWDNSLEFYKFAIGPYQKAMSGVMTEFYTKYGMINSSMVLGYPMVSFIALFGELGILGFYLLLRIFDDSFRDCNLIFIISFFMMSIFDTYFEIPCVLIMLIVATMISKKNKGGLKSDT